MPPRDSRRAWEIERDRKKPAKKAPEPELSTVERILRQVLRDEGNVARRDSLVGSARGALRRGGALPGTLLADPRAAARLQAAGVLPSLGGIDLSTTIKNLLGQAEDVPTQIGPALLSMLKNVGADTAHLPIDTFKAATGQEYDPPYSRTSENVVKPVAADIKYLATPGPVVARYDNTGRKVYRRPDGGETYLASEAAHGIAQKFQERPLDYLLATMAAPRAVGSIAALAKPSLAVPGRVSLTTRAGEEFSSPTSRNPYVRKRQETRRELSTRLTGSVEDRLNRELPVVGEHARAVRLAAKQQRRGERAEIARAVRPFEQAFRPLKAADKLAVVFYARGVRPSEMRAFVEQRKVETVQALAAARADGRNVEIARLRGEIHDHDKMLNLLTKTSDELWQAVPTDPKLATAYTEAKRLSDLGGDILEAVGKLDPETRALRPYLTARVVRGARFRPESLAEKGDGDPARFVGAYVRPADRENIGQITSVNPETGMAQVRFFNRETRRRGAKEFPLSDLRLVNEKGGEFVGGPSIDALKAELGDLIYQTDVGPALREGKVPQRASGAGKVRVPGLAKRNRAVRLMASRWLPTPAAWTDGFVKTIAYMHALDRGELALRVARDLNPDGSANRDWFYVNLDGQKLERAARERPALGEQMDEFLASDGDVEAFVRQRLASKDSADVKGWIERAQKEGREPRVGQISPADYRELFGDFRGSNRVVRALIDTPTDFWRTLTLTYRPAWVVNNAVGQTLLYVLNHSGPGGAAAYAASVLDEAKRSGRYFPEDLRYGLFAAEGAQAGGFLGAGALSSVRGAERRMRNKINTINSAVSDNVPRRAAWYAIAKKHNKLLNRIEGTNRTFDEFLTELQRAADNPLDGNAKLRQLHDDLVQEVLDELIDFSDLSAAERAVIRRTIPFYSWIKGITKATFRFGYEHPAKAALLTVLSETLGEQQLQRLLGLGEEILSNVDPIGKLRATAHGTVGTFIGTAGLNPFQTFGDVVRYARGGFLGDDSPASNPALAFGPTIKAAIETASGRNLYTGQELTGPRALTLPTQLARAFPQVSVAERILDPLAPVAGNGRVRLTVPGSTTRIPGTSLDVPNEVLNYLGLPIREKNVDRAVQIAQEQRAKGLSKPDRKYRESLNAEAKVAHALGLDDVPRPVVDDLLWKRTLETRYEKAERAKGYGLDPSERATIAAALVGERYPEAAENIQAGLQEATRQGDDALDSFTNAVTGEAFAALESWHRETDGAISELKVAS